MFEILAESDQKPVLAELRTVLGPQIEVVVEEGDEQDWSQLVLRHKGGPEIASIDRDPVAPDEMGTQEIEELVSGVKNARPTRNAEWLKHYFSHVKVVYTMQPLGGLQVKDGMATVLQRKRTSGRSLAEFRRPIKKGSRTAKGTTCFGSFMVRNKGN